MKLGQALGRLTGRRPTDRRSETGRRAEKLAARALVAEGYRVLETNLRLRSGEIDILAREGDTLAIVEVKSLADPLPGHEPEQAITAQKRRKLVRLARELQMRRRLDGVELRFDVVAVVFRGEETEVRILRRAFDATGRPA